MGEWETTVHYSLSGREPGPIRLPNGAAPTLPSLPLTRPSPAFSTIRATQRIRWECPSLAPRPSSEWPAVVTAREQEEEAVPWSCMPGTLPFPAGPALFPRGPLELQCAGGCARQWWPGWGWHCFLAGASPCLYGQCELHSEVGSGHPETRSRKEEEGLLRLTNPKLHLTKEGGDAQRAK